MTREIFKTLLIIALSIAGLFCAFTHASNYDWLEESLEPVADECQAVKWAIGSWVVFINFYCPEHNKDWEMVQVQKRVLIDLVAKEWKRFPGRYELLD